MCCYVTAGDEVQKHTTSILRDDQYFDSEADFCRVFSKEVLLYLERVLLANRISYFIREEHTNIFARLFSVHKGSVIVRVNARDMEEAMYLAEDIRGVEVIGSLPEEDWSPVRAKARREEEEQEALRFGQNRRDEEYRGEEDRWDQDYYEERTYRRRRA